MIFPISSRRLRSAMPISPPRLLRDATYFFLAAAAKLHSTCAPHARAFAWGRRHAALLFRRRWHLPSLMRAPRFTRFYISGRISPRWISLGAASLDSKKSRGFHDDIVMGRKYALTGLWAPRADMPILFLADGATYAVASSDTFRLGHDVEAAGIA